MREADLPAQQPEAQEEARVSYPYEEPRGPRRSEVSAQPRSRPHLGLIHRVRSRASFAEFARVRPRRDGPLWVRRIALSADATPQVAFAIGRKVGNAVTRNRLRRRLRALVVGHEDALRPGSAYLIGADARAVDASAEELDRALTTCLVDVR